ncbi:MULTISPECIES: ABC transporter substrate-binding protein [Pelosinus]|uniref:Extracellular ligand-binding receptor n=1 Tax=Pelosinus fermentans B4 TaxID=1149862 RepID=I9LJB2_9FIRM|nr:MULTISPECIES: ABC transporter substrate-binding protein [Pelosinus]EIW20511.1 Extracellular ligand-binding receptor [Pelosinus fermentans B4]EIW25774.1 Extracellular ligand-binding receptor [Pelosinus fermentans A11]OAM93498.1 extracellular ligand-binding receptor [Pelosinus fermentans DSM 17108]SDQ79907.1 amino acid/amide ABC transporter substrate-binding protein, HAAT family [Pelosinus fermentans]
MFKRMNAKWLSLFVVAILVAGLVAGCGGSASKDIKIGVVYELTGNTASFGTAAANGAKLAFKEINANGGVLGKQIQIAVADNKGEPSESSNAMTKVISQDKVIAVTGFTTSSNGIAGSTVAEANKIPFVAAATTNPKVTLDENTGKVKNYTFRVCFIDPFQGTVGANFVLNSLKAKNAAVMIDNSSDYSKGLSKFFKDAFTKGGGSIAIEEAYLQNDQDFKTLLTKIKASNPDVIYVPGYYGEVGKIIKQAREIGITVPFVGGDGWDSPKLAEIGGPDALNNTYFTNHYSVEDNSPKSKAFLDAFQKEYGQVPDAMAVLGYDAAYALVDAIKRANSTDSEKIREALANTKDFQGVTGSLTLNDTHDAIKSAVIIEMKNGKQVYKETVKP